jgi:predicted phosphoadenosine phosphosulfate sulfurtransferase
MSRIVYNAKENVLEAARRRISYIFDEFENIWLSVSGGKDSTAMYFLLIEEAERRERMVNVFFLDQEIEYQGTVEQIRRLMEHENVIPHWYQVPIYMTNATSYTEEFVYAWGEGEEWIRPKEPNSIHSIDGDYPKRFYEFFPWLEAQMTEPTAFCIGLRSKESLNRFRAVTRNPGYKDIPWSTRTDNPLAFRFYPLYDWCFGDVWKYIADNDLPYNDVYDKLFRLHGINIREMRVSVLMHEKSYDCLADLQEIEPENYDRVIERIGGAHCAARYAEEDSVYHARQLPDAFDSWCEYRDYLLETTPYKRRERFKERFAAQPENEHVCRQQVHQLQINDWENNVPVKKRKKDWRKKWMEIL